MGPQQLAGPSDEELGRGDVQHDVEEPASRHRDEEGGHPRRVLLETSQRGVFVSNCPGKNAAAVAELTFGLILAIDRRIVDCASGPPLRLSSSCVYIAPAARRNSSAHRDRA
jgi:hypothetical protein